MTRTTTVAVTGATGFVGRALTRALLQRGHAVRALTRSADKAASVLPPAAGELEIVVGDALGQGVIDRLVDGAGAVINLLGIIREKRGQRFQGVHVEATRRCLEAATRAGAGRYIQMSALGVSDEGICEYQKTKWAAEELVRKSGLDWTIFRPSLIHGPEGEFTEMMISWARGKIAPWKFMPYFGRPETDISVPAGPTRYIDPEAQPVYVEDVAAYFADALTNDDAIGEIYNLVGPERLAWPDMLRTVRDTIPGGFDHIEPLRIPADIAAFNARAAELLGVGALLPFDAGMAKMGAQDSVAGLEKARADFDIEPSGFTTALRAYAQTV
ncbi:MAG: NAD(P)H-binding protein [Phycisphaerales bacterium JB039]